MMLRVITAAIFLISSMLMGACGGSSGGDDSLEIVGSYTDEWGSNHVIDQNAWDMDGSLFHISQYDNDAGFLVAQNDSGNEYNPNLWSRFDWSWQGADLYYCQCAFDAADESAALAASADPTDLEGGCSGFAWSLLTPLP